MIRPIRWAYTLIELIVVIGILAILMALLLPAVQNVRATASRMQCANHLKQLALAALQYHDTEEKFPPAFRKGNTEAYPQLNWTVRLLPYLEQDAAWQAVTSDFSRNRDPFFAVPAHSIKDKVFPVFACPADWRANTAWTLNVLGKTHRVSFTTYLGNSGTVTGRADGVIYRDSGVRIVHIADGSSNTLLIGERPPSVDYRFGWFYAGVGQDGNGALDSVIGTREKNLLFDPKYKACGPGPFPFQARKVDDPCAVFQYWSQHPGGANFALCDGSVRFIRYENDSILSALSTRAGGEIAELP